MNNMLEYKLATTKNIVHLADGARIEDDSEK